MLTPQRIWLVLSVLLTVGTVIALVSSLDTRQVVSVFRTADRAGLAMGFALFALANMLKAERLRVVTTRSCPIGRWSHYGLVCVYNLLSSMLPAGIGELSYPAMLRSRYETPVATGVAAVLVTRVLDLIVVAACFVAALGILPWHPAASVAAFIVAIAAAATLLAGLARVAIASAVMTRRPAIGRWSRLVRVLGDELRQAAALATRSSRLAVGLLTVAIWTTGYASTWLVSRALGFPLGIRAIVVCSSLMLLLSALPFKGFLGFGTQHVAWIAGLALLGSSDSNPLQLATAIHLTGVAYTVILGGIGGMLMIADTTNFDAAGFHLWR